MDFVIRLLANMAGIWLADTLVSGIALPESTSSWTNFLTLLIIGAVFTAINMVVRPLVKVLTFPIYILTLGLFALVVNALMFMLTGWLTTQIGYGLAVSGFGAAFLGAIITAIVAALVSAVLRKISL
ncbi:MAG: phage holin family protein [Actinomycetaceae bacterium]|nr:phage holin family protein [Actinomycetaceae bacterium]